MEPGTSGLTVCFDGTSALREVTLRFEGGEHVGVCGAAGSGKTTLLKALAGLRRPDEGRVLWDGQDPWTLPPEVRRARQASFGMVFQTDALFDAQTVLENVLGPLRRRGVPEAEAQARAHESLRQVGLEDAGGLLPGQLSGGMQKRAGIARAIVARPAVLLADDPLAGLDPSTASQVAALLREVSFGRTLLVAMPDPLPWMEASRWLLLDGGRLTYDGPFDAARLDRT